MQWLRDPRSLSPLRRSAHLALCTAAAGCLSAPLYQAPQRIDLVVAATTDVHGYLRGWDYYSNTPDTLRGLTRAATIVDSLRRVSPVTPVLVDAGDLLQGSPLAYVAARLDTVMPHPVILAMNAMQYDAAVVGNHEFNYGLATLNRAVKQADFPFLAANAYTPDGKQPFRAWALSTRRGIKIAIVGATTPGAMLWDRDNLAGRLVIRDIVPAVRAAVRDAQGAGVSVIIVVLHSGLNEPSSYDTISTGVPSENVAARVAREVPGIDLLVYGHSHKEMRDTVIGTTLVMQPRNWAGSVGVAHLSLEKQNNRWRVLAKRSQLVQAAHHPESASLLAATAEGHRAALAYVRTTIGSTPVTWRADSARVVDTPLMDFILEVERKVSGAQLASTAAFSLDASIAAGPITVARIAALYPYDNTLRAVRISGAQLRAYLEQSARYFRPNGAGGADIDPGIPGFNYDMVSGVDYTIDVSRPIGQRITQLDFQGRAVAPADTFTMALNNYRQTGGGGFDMLRGAPVVYDEQVEIRQALIDEVRRTGTLVPADYFHPNWRIVPSSAIGHLVKPQ
jgi:2',3'-cyclic-nucleotide 2'-phosphodiesterase (5'-nucleotidase family)